MDSAEDTAGGLIGSINDGNAMDCADIKVSDYTADGLIAIATDNGNLTDCVQDSAGGLIAAIDAGALMYFTDKLIYDDAADGLIATPIYSTENDDINVSDDAIDGLMMLIALARLVLW